MAPQPTFVLYGIECRQSANVHKIGTDTLLLAHCVMHHDAKLILDIGTGTGILALVMAQKHINSRVFGIDIDFSAAQLAQSNICNSKYADRCLATEISLDSFKSTQKKGTFDLILSNPPYFAEPAGSPHSHRNTSRQESTMSPDQIFEASQHLLATHGALWLIFPCTRTHIYRQAACLHGLYDQLEIQVSTQAGSPANRTIVRYGRNPVTFERKTMIWGQGKEETIP
jgi:tRNA1Val (adenine37-N6)-methyltransferase